MGNEFGHPEWIDFPREGNGWSYHYCRRQWSLVDNDALRYMELNDFDKAMISLLKDNDLLGVSPVNRWMHQDDKIIIFTKGDYAFAFNFHPYKSFEGYFIPVGNEGAGKYKIVLSSDDGKFGGFGRTDSNVCYETYNTDADWTGFNCYLPSRSAVVFKKIKK
jgi:1,4-alpha-glucan branching enzyme